MLEEMAVRISAYYCGADSMSGPFCTHRAAGLELQTWQCKVCVSREQIFLKRPVTEMFLCF